MIRGHLLHYGLVVSNSLLGTSAPCSVAVAHRRICPRSTHLMRACFVVKAGLIDRGVGPQLPIMPATIVGGGGREGGRCDQRQPWHGMAVNNNQTWSVRNPKKFSQKNKPRKCIHHTTSEPNTKGLTDDIVIRRDRDS